MAKVILSARIFGDDDKPVQRLAVMVESFDPGAGRWSAVARARTGADGSVTAEIDLRQIDQARTVPALRLTDDAGGVLSEGPMLSLDPQARTLMADFGEIERLGDAGFARQDSRGEDRDRVAGLPRKEGLPQATLIRSMGDLSAVRRDIPGLAAVRDAQPAALDPRITLELSDLQAVNLRNTARIEELDRLVATRDHELTLRTTELQAALTRAREAETRLDQVQEERKGKEADIQSVFTNIGTKLGDAHVALKSSQNPFRIGTVRVDLKGALAEDGKIVLGADRSDGSGVSVEMSPESAAGDRAGATVPDVTGLTQSAAHRILRSVGLRLKAASQSAPQGAAHGQALRQSPAAGRTAPHGTEVLVVFATAPES